MRLSTSLFQTLREAPAEAEVPSHRLMLRAGLIQKTAAGIYVYGPLLWRTLGKISRIVRDEMDRAGGQECLLPQLQPYDLWRRSGRLETYVRSGIMFTLKDRKGGEFCLGPTHEEVVTDFVAANVRSYKQRPRPSTSPDEVPRRVPPAFGLMRARVHHEGPAPSRRRAGSTDPTPACAAYVSIFGAAPRVPAVQADAGDIGGPGARSSWPPPARTSSSRRDTATRLTSRRPSPP
jgi:prolyl-tRNA synthetase